MIGHCSRFGENNDLPIMRTSRKEKADILYSRALITHEVFRSRDAR